MRTYSFHNQEAVLYLVATPIGNLEDMTFRAVRILKEVSKIYAEDTRNSRVLLDHYGITTPLESYHEFNQDVKTDELLNMLKENKSIAIISDAGLPVISDPGFKIVKKAVDEGFAVTTIPGASAGISALVSSGIVGMPYTFFGFLDSKSEKRRKELTNLKYQKETLIFYEAPHRIFQTLEDMLQILGDRYICLSRELTKKFEEHIRGKISEILKIDNLKGEMVLIVSGAKDVEEILVNKFDKIEEFINLGYKPKEAINEVARIMNIDKKELYYEFAQFKSNK